MRARTGFRPAQPFSLGAYLELFGGTDFGQTGAFGFTLGGQPTLHFGERFTFALGLHFDGIFDSWQNRADLSEDGVSVAGSKFALRLRFSGDLVYWAAKDFGIFAGLQGRLVGDQRALFQDALFGVFENDPGIYAHIGLTFGFGK